MVPANHGLSATSMVELAEMETLRAGQGPIGICEHPGVDSNSRRVAPERYRAYPALAMREARFLKASSLTGFTPVAEIQRL
jgi:hypothetical protein